MRSSKRAYMATLVSDALEGDSNSYAVLFASSYKDLYTYISKIVPKEYDIQDILFGTYISAFTNLSDLHNPNRFHKWIRIICDGRLKGHLREQGKSELEIGEIMSRKGQKYKAKKINGLENAGELLEYVFLEMNLEANSVPLETLYAYHQYRSNRLILQKLLLFVALVVIVLIPFFFFKPSIKLTKNVEKSTMSMVVYEAEVNSFVPISTVVAAFSEGDNEALVMRESENLYYIYVLQNGDLTATAASINGQEDASTVSITEIDSVPPVLMDYRLVGDTIVIQITDQGYGVDYRSTSATDVDTQAVYTPISYDATTGTVVMPYTHSTMALNIVDVAGNSAGYTIQPN